MKKKRRKRNCRLFTPMNCMYVHIFHPVPLHIHQRWLNKLLVTFFPHTEVVLHDLKQHHSFNRIKVHALFVFFPFIHISP